MDEHRDREADRRGIDECLIAGNDAALFESVDPAPNRRDRQANLLRKLGVRQARVLLQESQDAPIDLVYPGLWTFHAFLPTNLEQLCAYGAVWRKHRNPIADRTG